MPSKMSSNVFVIFIFTKMFRIKQLKSRNGIKTNSDDGEVNIISIHWAGMLLTDYGLCGVITIIKRGFVSKLQIVGWFLLCPRRNTMAQITQKLSVLIFISVNDVISGELVKSWLISYMPKIEVTPSHEHHQSNTKWQNSFLQVFLPRLGLLGFLYRFLQIKCEE